jgi:hypothetical protein
MELVSRADVQFGQDLARRYRTVRGLMNSRAPISWVVRPSRASRAIQAALLVSIALALATVAS